MAFDVDAMLKDFGIDTTTVQIPDATRSKWNGYLAEADHKYAEAAAQVAKAASDQAAIDDQIRQFGINEGRVAELETSNAAYKAAFDKVKGLGLNVDLSGLPNPQLTPAPDPVKTLEGKLNSLAANMSAGMRVQTKYYSTFQKPLPIDIDTLIGEANAARLPVEQYAEQKYKFADETARIEKEARAKEIQAGVDAGVKKWQEEHPVTRGNPALSRGVNSQHSRVFKPRTADESKQFRQLSTKDRIANSVQRVREALASSE